MRKLIYQVNISLDGYADHTLPVADAELHDFFTAQYDEVDTILLGRVTYELMDYWHHAIDDPAANKSMVRFAEKFNSIQKVVFSRTLEKPAYDNERLVKDDPAGEVRRLKEQPGKDITIGGIALAAEFARQGLVDEYLVLVHPVVAGKGRRLLEGIPDPIKLKLIEMKKLGSGAVALRYIKAG